MTAIQRLILEDDDTTYEVLVEPSEPIQTSKSADEYESYGLSGPARSGTIPPEIRVKLKDVHQTIQGYAQYALGAFKNLSVAEVEELNLKFNLKISAEGGLPVLASGKTEADFSIEVKCKFPK